MNSIKEAIRHINMGLTQSENRQIVTFFTLDGEIAQQTLIVNLAVMYGKVGEKTIILDTEFGNGLFSNVFNLKPGKGLSDYLDDYTLTDNDIIQEVTGHNVGVITSGSENGEHYQTGDPRFSRLIKSLTNKYDHVFINTPSYQDSGEFSSLLTVSDGVIIVSALKVTKKSKMYHLVDYLKKEMRKF